MFNLLFRKLKSKNTCSDRQILEQLVFLSERLGVCKFIYPDKEEEYQELLKVQQDTIKYLEQLLEKE